MRHARLLALAVAIAALAACGDEGRLLQARQVENRFQLVGGPVAMADVGDYVLENDKIRVAILGPRHSPGPAIFGGSIVDADVRRPFMPTGAGQGRDRLSEVFPMANLLVPRPEELDVRVIDDGSSGEQAVIRVEGEGAFLFDAVGVLDSRKADLELMFKDLKTQMRFRTDYSLRPGDAFVKLETTLVLPDPRQPKSCEPIDGCDLDCEYGLRYGPDLCLRCECDTPLKMSEIVGTTDIFRTVLGDFKFPVEDFPQEIGGGLIAGDFVFFGNQNDIFGPGMGFDETKAVFDALFGGRDVFKSPLSFDFLAASGGDISYGYFTLSDDGTPTSVNVPLFTSAATAILTSTFNCLLDEADDEACDARRAFTYTRYFAVGDGDIASVAEVIFDAKGIPTGRVAGGVFREGTLAPIPHARVMLFEDPEPGRAWESVDALLDALWETRGDNGLLNVIDADHGIDPIVDGKFGARVPAGTYVVVARSPDGTSMSAPIPITVAAGKTTRVAPVLPPPATLRYRITDETGALMPGKIQLVALDDGGRPMALDGRRRVFMGDSRLGNGIRHQELSASGEGEMLVEPGRYQLTITRGIEYSRFVAPDISLGPGEVRRVEAALRHEVDTKGWASIDMHIHSRPSHDSGMRIDRRVRTAVAEGLDVAVSTDHDVLTDYRPTIRKLRVEPFLQTAIGVEISTVEMGHYIGFPLEYDALDHPDHGAYDWTCRTAKEIVEGIRATGAGGADPLIILAHPRDGVFGYVEQAGLDNFTGGRELGLGTENNILLRTGYCDFDALEVFNAKRFDTVHTPTVAEVALFNQCLARIDAATTYDELDGVCPEVGEGVLDPCPDYERFPACKMRQRRALSWAVEKRILTRTPEEHQAHWSYEGPASALEDLCQPFDSDGAPVELAEEDRDKPCTFHSGTIEDYLRYLDHDWSFTSTGRPPTQVGSSDSHGGNLEPGTSRTYFRVDTDVPGNIPIAEALASLKAGHAFPTFGPFIRASIGGATYGDVADGTAGDSAKLDLRVETASWIGTDRIEVYSDGKLIDAIEVSGGPEPIVDFDGTVDVPLPDHDTWVVVVAMGLSDDNLLRPTIVDVPFGELQLPRIAALALANVPLVGEVLGSTPPVPDFYPIPPFAITNAIFIDRDGNGAYDPPKGPLPFCSQPCDPGAEDDPDSPQCPDGQMCLPEERLCGFAIDGVCEGKSFMTSMLTHQ